MTDREVLLIAYGALKAIEVDNENIKELVVEIQTHLFPAPEPSPADKDSNGEND